MGDGVEVHGPDDVNDQARAGTPGRKYGIWCSVSGGVTGSRQGWYKSYGKRVEFNTLEEAKVEAEQMTKSMNGNPNRTANFSYAPTPI